MFQNFGLFLLDNVEGPPAQSWVWVWHGWRSQDGSCYELNLFRESPDGSQWGYHAIVIGTWYRPPSLARIEATSTGSSDSLFGGVVWDA